MSRPIIHIGALPPPTGGVSVHCERIVESMSRGGLDVDIVNLRRLTAQLSTREIVGWKALQRILRARRDSSTVFLHYSGSTDLLRTALLALAAGVVARRHLVLLQHNGAYGAVLVGRHPTGAIHRWLVRRAAIVMCLNEALESDTLTVAPEARCVRCVSFVASSTIAAVRHQAAISLSADRVI